MGDCGQSFLAHEAGLLGWAFRLLDAPSLGGGAGSDRCTRLIENAG